MHLAEALGDDIVFSILLRCIGREDDDLGADEAGEGGGGLGEDTGELDRFGEEEAWMTAASRR